MLVGKSFFVVTLLILSISICLASFSDLSTNHWAYESVMNLTELGIISGMPDGTFRGNDPMTRYQSAVAMKRLLDFFKMQNGVNTTVPTDLQNRLSEMENLVNKSLNAVQKVGKDYQGIIEKLENLSIGNVNSVLEYDELEKLVDEILEVKLDNREIESAINRNDNNINQLNQENQQILTQLDRMNMASDQTSNSLREMESKINTFRWVSISSMVIAVGSFIMAGYVLWK